jgi:hypothetical protein
VLDRTVKIILFLKFFEKKKKNFEEKLLLLVLDYEKIKTPRSQKKKNLKY